MELIIAILFFSLASTVCIQLFTKAHLLSKETVNQNNAIIHIQNLAEGFHSAEGNIDNLALLFENSVVSTSESSDVPNILTLYFDKNWKTCTASDANYLATLTSSPDNEDGLIRADINVTDSNLNVIHSINVLHHIPERRGNIE